MFYSITHTLCSCVRVCVCVSPVALDRDTRYGRRTLTLDILAPGISLEQSEHANQLLIFAIYIYYSLYKDVYRCVRVCESAGCIQIYTPIIQKAIAHP